MDRVARITVLAENSVQGFRLLAEHGLAFWLEIDGRRLLFDTGQGLVLSNNARHLGVPLERTDAIVLSHGHYDHTGGLGKVLQAAPRAKLYAHPTAFEPKYGRANDGTCHEIGIPSLSARAARERASDVIRTEAPTEVLPAVFATGEIPRRTEYEDTGGPFFSDRECRQADPLLDDQALFLDSRRGTVVLLGCAHAGVINTLQYVHELTVGKPIHAVIGGTHLATASRDRMDRTIAALRPFDIDRLGAAHCTGLAAIAELWSAFPGRCMVCAAGTRMAFELA